MFLTPLPQDPCQCPATTYIWLTTCTYHAATMTTNFSINQLPTSNWLKERGDVGKVCFVYLSGSANVQGDNYENMQSTLKHFEKYMVGWMPSACVLVCRCSLSHHLQKAAGTLHDSSPWTGGKVNLEWFVCVGKLNITPVSIWRGRGCSNRFRLRRLQGSVNVVTVLDIIKWSS